MEPVKRINTDRSSLEQDGALVERFNTGWSSLEDTGWPMKRCYTGLPSLDHNGAPVKQFNIVWREMRRNMAAITASIRGPHRAGFNPTLNSLSVHIRGKNF